MTAFPSVRGHERAQGLLGRAIERGRLHHCLLLLGPRGVGKRTLARGLACALNCDVEPARGCGSCVTCSRILAGRHTDFVVVEGIGRSKLITVPVVEPIIVQSLHAPYEARTHVIVFDPADRLNEPAANKLLKTLEEPRPGIQFVLLAENASRLLPTIRSRSMSIPLSPLEPSELADVVTGVLGDDIDPGTLELSLSLSDGVPGRAIELAGDASLADVKATLGAALNAVVRGPAGVFAGDAGELWSTWKRAVRAAPDPEIDPIEEDEPEVVVVKADGRKRKGRKKKKKKARKAVPAWGTPAQQRATAQRLTELWLLHLRETMRGRPGLAGMPALALSAGALVEHVAVVQELQSSLQKNPNVRLAVESTVLRLSARS